MKSISFQAMFLQLKQDLIGKDAFRGVTLSYTWLANQFGHFALGFIPATLFYMKSNNKTTGNMGIYLPSLVVWSLWLAFEFINFLVSITKPKRDPATKAKVKKIFYSAKKWHFIYDVFTDMCFFGLGAASACLVFSTSFTTILLAVAFVCLLIPASYYWYRSKIYLQRALYPFQFRLSQWTYALSDANKETVNRFMEDRFCGTQLLVLGEDYDMKIKLCVGIGNEMSYQLRRCRYLTAMKTFEAFYRNEAEDSKESHRFAWNWQESDLLIIDDINPSHFHIDEVIKTGAFLKQIDNDFSERNRKSMREKKVIWVLGNELPGQPEQRNWTDLLEKIGVDPSNILSIDLSEKTPVNV